MPLLVESLYQHSAWATERLIEVCETLSDEQLDAPRENAAGSIRHTLVHTLSAEQYYLSRVGAAPPPDPVTEGATFPGFDVLKRAARANGEALAAAAAANTPDDVVPGRDSDTFGEADASVFLVQAMNHSAEHRTQILSILTTLGHGPPAFSEQIDGWSWGAASGGMRSRAG